MDLKGKKFKHLETCSNCAYLHIDSCDCGGGYPCSHEGWPMCEAGMSIQNLKCFPHKVKKKMPCFELNPFLGPTIDGERWCDLHRFMQYIINKIDGLPMWLSWDEFVFEHCQKCINKKLWVKD